MVISLDALGSHRPECLFLSYAECHVLLEVRSPLAAVALLAVVGTAAMPGRTRVLCLLAMEPSASTSTLAISMLAPRRRGLRRHGASAPCTRRRWCGAGPCG
jgi:hypothetical protein